VAAVQTGHLDGWLGFFLAWFLKWHLLLLDSEIKQGRAVLRDAQHVLRWLIKGVSDNNLELNQDHNDPHELDRPNEKLLPPEKQKPVNHKLDNPQPNDQDQ
tara:strand:- start:17 stop:319 length:303 start_codon:yes stop_codon:yes gene_type:complete